MLVLEAHNTTTPVATELLIVVVLFPEGDRELLKILEVLLVHLGEGNAGSGLHVDELTEVGLSADEGVGNILSAAEGGQVKHGLNWVNIVGDDNQLGGALLNEGRHVVKTELDVDWLGGLTSTGLLSGGLESELLLLSGLGHVLGEELEELGG